MEKQNYRTSLPLSGHPRPPEFIRLPLSGSRCPHTGLTRSTLNELILPNARNNYTPPVKSVVQKKPYAIRGIRLIHFQSLIDYLNSLPNWDVKKADDQGEETTTTDRKD